MSNENNPQSPANFAPNAIPTYAQMPSLKPQFQYTGRDAILSAVMLLLGFMFMRCVFINTAGFFTSAFFILLMVICLIYLKHENVKLSFYCLTLCGVYFAFSLVFSITDNDLIKSLDTVFLMLLGAYTVFAAANGREKPNRHFTFDMLKSVFSVPFSGFGYATKALKTGKKSGIRTVLLVILGLIVTVPLTLIIFSLLSSADESFGRVIGDFFENFDFNIVFVFELILAIPVGFYLFGLVFSNVKKIKANLITDEWYDMRRENMRFLPTVTAYAAVTPIVILYIVFVFLQADYFFSAFGGTLPAAFSYSEYARQGFFELFRVAIINLFVIAALTLFSKNRADGKKPLALRIYTAVLAVLTLLILVTAFSKMALYIKYCALTWKRVYVSWFLILLAVFFIVIIIKQFREKLCIANVMSVVFTLLFAVLCFGNIDGQIARYNIWRFTEYGERVDLEALYQLSDDGWAVVLESEEFDGTDDQITEESSGWAEIYCTNDYVSANWGDKDRLEALSNNRQQNNDYRYSYYNFSSLAVKSLTEKMSAGK